MTTDPDSERAQHDHTIIYLNNWMIPVYADNKTCIALVQACWESAFHKYS